MADLDTRGSRRRQLHRTSEHRADNGCLSVTQIAEGVERTCITLFYMEDVSIDKIAGITGIPAGTVKSHLSRGKKKLATYLKRNGYDGNR